MNVWLSTEDRVWTMARQSLFWCQQQESQKKIEFINKNPLPSPNKSFFFLMKVSRFITSKCIKGSSTDNTNYFIES